MDKRFSGGFTLMELLIVIVMIVVLASLAYPSYTKFQERARGTQDMSNLRQIGLATQMYLNDNDGVLFAPNTVWPKSLVTKYMPSWKILRSAFDKRADTENADSAPVSYGLNANAKTSTAALSMDKIVNSGGFILFAPAQNSAAIPTFQGLSNATVTVEQENSTPGGAATGGTHNNRAQINVCFADLHQETLKWLDFKSDLPEAGIINATKSQRWHPDPANP